MIKFNAHVIQTIAPPRAGAGSRGGGVRGAEALLAASSVADPGEAIELGRGSGGGRVRAVHGQSWNAREPPVSCVKPPESSSV